MLPNRRSLAAATLAAATALALAAPASHAATLVQGVTWSAGGNLVNVPLDRFGAPTNTDLRGVNTPLNFELFNPAWGTLQSVTWKLPEMNIGFVLDNRVEIAGRPAIVRFDLAATAKLTTSVGADAGLRGTGGSTFKDEVRDAEGCGGFNPAGIVGITGCMVRTEGSSTRTGLSLQASQLSAFLGSGSFSQVVNGELSWDDRIDAAWNLPSLSPLLSTNSALNGSFNVNGRLELVYTYAPVPEPAAWLLLAGALPVLVLRRRRVAARA